MTHPGAQAVCRQRKAIVEPVFSALRQQRGLSRFRRRGLAGVKREFALHILAYNVARAVARSVSCFVGGQSSSCQLQKMIATTRMSAIESPHHRHRRAAISSCVVK